MAASVVPLIIDGQDYIPQKTFNVTSPATGNVVHKCASASVPDASRAVNAAAEALKTWRATAPQERRDIFWKAADIMDSRRDELMQYAIDETGATKGWGEFNLNTAINILKDVAGRVSSLQGTMPQTRDPTRSAMVVREPYGVVLSIAPWYVVSNPI